MGVGKSLEMFQKEAGAKMAFFQVVSIWIFDIFHDYVWNHDFSNLSGVRRCGFLETGGKIVLDL